jgi:hypothetical protein
VIDEIQDRHLRVTHEAAHCVAAHLLGHRIKEVDCDRPEDGTAGWVQYEKPDGPLDQPRRRVRERAVIARVGAMATRMDWENDPGGASDRAAVLKIARLLEVPEPAFEWDVEHEARELMADPRFDVALRALCRELADHLREAMPGERAHAIMNDAILAGFARMWRPHDAVRV